VAAPASARLEAEAVTKTVRLRARACPDRTITYSGVRRVWVEGERGQELVMLELLPAHDVEGRDAVARPIACARVDGGGLVEMYFLRSITEIAVDQDGGGL
jgi:hypothetical protein